MSDQSGTVSPRFIVHQPGDNDLLVAFLADPPMDGSEADGRGTVSRPIAPEQANLEWTRERAGEPCGDAELDRANAAWVRLWEAGLTVVNLNYYGANRDTHIFGLEAGPVLDRVWEVSQRQSEPAEWKMKFLVEGVAAIDFHQGTVNRHVSVSVLLPEGSLPEGWCEEKHEESSRTLLVYSHTKPEFTEEMASEARTFVRALLASHTVLTGQVVRVCWDYVQPIQRRRSIAEIGGPVVRIARAAPPSDFLAVLKTLLDNNEADVAAQGVRRTLEPWWPADGLLSLWTALERLFRPQRKSVVDGVSKSGRRAIKRVLCQTLGDECGCYAWEQLCQVLVPSRNEAIADGIAQAFPDTPREEILRLLQSVSRTRAAVTHDGVALQELPREARSLLSMLRIFVALKSGIDPRSLPWR